jgi:ferric-dicitrate binding protein FerR (iron transport regulator)
VFRDAPLADVAREFNRYNSMQTQIEDADIGARLMNGTYSVDRPQILARYLEMDGSVVVTPQGNGWIVHRR